MITNYGTRNRVNFFSHQNKLVFLHVFTYIRWYWLIIRYINNFLFHKLQIVINLLTKNFYEFLLYSWKYKLNFFILKYIQIELNVCILRIKKRIFDIFDQSILLNVWVIVQAVTNNNNKKANLFRRVLQKNSHHFSFLIQNGCSEQFSIYHGEKNGWSLLKFLTDNKSNLILCVSSVIFH